MFRNKYFVGAIHPPLKTGGFLAKSLRGLIKRFSLTKQDIDTLTKDNVELVFGWGSFVDIKPKKLK